MTDLLQHIKSDRAKKRKKQGFRSTLFDKIGGLVHEYNLGESFLRELENPDVDLLEGDLELARLRKKQPFEVPLYALLKEKDYRLTVAIIQRLDNEYLEFAQSPDEIVISKQLFDLNPSIGVDKLETYHFETLLLCEHAKRELRRMAKPDSRISEKEDTGSEMESLGDQHSSPDSSVERMKQLQSLIHRVEDRQS